MKSLLIIATVTLSVLASNAFGFISVDAPKQAFNFKYKVSGNDNDQFAETDLLKITYFLVPVDTTKEIKDIK